MKRFAKRQFALQKKQYDMHAALWTVHCRGSEGTEGTDEVVISEIGVEQPQGNETERC